jgi:DNA-binding transcriptional regulator YhcF (GntR family)
MDLKKEKGKSHKIAEAIKAEIVSGKMRPGNRLKSVRELASKFSVSIKSAQRAFDALEVEGLIERKPGSGAFVKESTHQKNNTIYFLVPHASHMMLEHETSIAIRRMLYGAINSALPSQLIQMIPVSKSSDANINKRPETIDWSALECIPAGANVFISSAWYSKIIPFLVERGVRGIYLATQFEQAYQDMYGMIRESRWPIIKIDRFTAIQNAVNHLYSLGRRRIAAIKSYPNQPDHPFRKGFISGYEHCMMPFKDELFQEFTPSQPGNEEEMIFALWESSEFDSLIICAPGIVRDTFQLLTQKLKLKIPDDVALLAFRDMPNYLSLPISISVFDFPWVEIGAEIVTVANAENTMHREIRFQSAITDRDSTLKRSSNETIGAFLPEHQVNRTFSMEMV